ncbi:DUF6273 domain-containing protein [Gemella cuniculi]|uniref:DUF6273 domain-containing protein n=1 Tax=Gemella cuniculi TaxID=150240 RepID=UPI0003FD15B3|nr:DUF6273 domain-containing protein [Gemella cuniculi]
MLQKKIKVVNKSLKIILILGITLPLVACGQTNSSTSSSENVKQNEASSGSKVDENMNMKLLGKYPKNGEDVEPIEWIVLEESGDKVLLLAKNCIDSLPWHKTHEAITWDKSDIRTWLNGEFLQKAFTPEEQDSILTTDLDNSDNLKYGTTVGENTKDKVFLLSGAEVEKYFSSESARRAQPTVYATSHGAYSNGSGECAWWLRSPGVTETSPAYIASAGMFGNRAHEVNETIIGVRPAIWVMKDKLK